MMDQGNVIEVSHVGKSFKVYFDKGSTLKDRFLSRGRSRYEEREVLKDINFTVKKGEAVGLVGKNGSGKSTTLKLLTKIIYPNHGKIEMRGRVSSLLELGAGFHPDMSGRENIYMNAAVFGLNRKEIDDRISDIIQFSELEEYIDNPVRTYSSGMYMRLAFSVAINVEADILLVDEILAVGDISFQKKCFDKLKEIKRQGTTIVIVSHSMDQIEKICDKSIWIEDGYVKEEGYPKLIHEHYLYSMEKDRLQRFQEEYYKEVIENTVEAESDQKSVSVEQPLKKVGLAEEKVDHTMAENDKSGISEEMKSFTMNLLHADRADVIQGDIGRVRFTELYITDHAGEEKIVFETGESIVFYIKFHAMKAGQNGTICFLMYREDGLYCYGTTSFIEKHMIVDFDQYSVLKINLNEVPLLPGKYFLTLAIHDEQAVEFERIERAATLQFLSEKAEQGMVRIDTEWNLE